MGSFTFWHWMTVGFVLVLPAVLALALAIWFWRVERKGRRPDAVKTPGASP